MSALFASILSADAGIDDHASGRRARAADASPSEIRLRSSAGARCSHSGFGTTPNIAPPSRRKKPSRQRDELEVAELTGAPSRVTGGRPASARRARRARCDGWMKATSDPCAPGRGASSISRTPRAFSCASAAAMSSTRSVMWWSPGPRFATNLAIGESSAVGFEQFDAALAGRDEVRAHALRRHLLGRLDLEAERVAIERERVRRGPRRRCRCDRGVAFIASVSGWPRSAALE